MVRIGAKITIVATVPLTIVQCFMEDKVTMANLVGNVTADLIKVAIGTMIGGLTGLAIGAVTTTAAAPIFFTILVSVLVGTTLQILDDHYGLTDSLVTALEKVEQAIANKKEEMEKSLGRKLHELERELIYRSCGYNIDNPFK
jgi:predicted membrane protein